MSTPSCRRRAVRPVTSQFWRVWPLPAPLAVVMFTIGALCLSACSLVSVTAAPTATVTADPLTILRHRPLHYPSLAAGALCPKTSGVKVSANYGPAIGGGPAYAVLGRDDGVLSYGDAQPFGGGDYGGNKVLWIVSPAYHDLVLIRGHQLGGNLDVRFETGADPPQDLSFTAFGLDPGGWSGQPSYTRVKAPGCYAYQVDGLTFSEIIIFQAVPLT
jgi:hypothetical protein